MHLGDIEVIWHPNYMWGGTWRLQWQGADYKQTALLRTCARNELSKSSHHQLQHVITPPSPSISPAGGRRRRVFWLCSHHMSFIVNALHCVYLVDLFLRSAFECHTGYSLGKWCSLQMVNMCTSPDSGMQVRRCLLMGSLCGSACPHHLLRSKTSCWVLVVLVVLGNLECPDQDGAMGALACLEVSEHPLCLNWVTDDHSHPVSNQ